MMYCGHLTSEKLSKMYKGKSNKNWKYNNCEGTFYYLWWTYKTANEYWDQISCLIHKILKMDVKLQSEAFLWISWIIRLKENMGFCIYIWQCKDFFYMHIEIHKFPQLKLMELAGMAKLIIWWNTNAYLALFRFWPLLLPPTFPFLLFHILYLFKT